MSAANKAIAMVAAGLALGVVVSLVGGSSDDPEYDGGIETEPSKLGVLEDGGKGYFHFFIHQDGGRGRSRSDVGGCVRAKCDGGSPSCKRKIGAGAPFDPGDCNRFPSSEAVGSCENVACGVYSGEDPSLDEDYVVSHGKVTN